MGSATITTTARTRTTTRRTRISIQLSYRKLKTTTSSTIVQSLLAFLIATITISTTTCVLCSIDSTNNTDNFYHEAPLPLADSALMRTGLYAAHDIANDPSSLQSASKVSPCQPKHVHLSVGVTPWNSMTVSFSVPRDCYAADHGSIERSIADDGVEYGGNDNPNNTVDVLRTSLWYGLASSAASNSSSNSDDTHTTAAMTEISLDDLFFMSEYNFTHNHTHTHTRTHTHRHTNHNIYYTSDYIFHVPLIELQPSQFYHYQISVSQYRGPANNNTNNTYNTNNTNNTKPRSLSSLRQSQSQSHNNNNNHSAKYNTTTSTFISLSPILSFKTSQLPSANGGPGTKMAIVGDLGQTYNSSVTMLHMYQAATTTDYNVITNTNTTNNNDTKTVTLALCVGDMSYADSNPKRWDSWFALIEPLLSRIPLVTAAGNHEIETTVNSTQPPFVPYEHRFRNPRIRPTVRTAVGGRHLYNIDYKFGNSYYDFVHGITHVVVLNCYADTSYNSTQYNYFRGVFEGGEIRYGRNRFDRGVTPWLVVMSHCPLYNTFSDHRDEPQTTDMLRHMEYLFLKYGVNLVFSGHTHGYSRSTELRYGEVVGGDRATAAGRRRRQRRGPVYITVGEGGNREGHCPTYNATTPEDWIVKRDITEFGFGIVDFINATTLHWKWVRNEDADTFRFTDEVFLKNQWLEEEEEEVVSDAVVGSADYFHGVGDGMEQMVGRIA